MIHYFTYYSNSSSRLANLAGEDKIDYICETLKLIGEEVTLVSSAKSKEPKYLPKERVKTKKDIDLVYFASLPNVNMLTHIIDIIWGYIQLITYVICHVKKSDIVLVYHSLGYRDIFTWLHKIKKFKYILEVEELYQYIDANKNPFKKREDSLFCEPDVFIFSNDILAESVNIYEKPQVIINGIYKCESKCNSYYIKDSYEKRRIVYAGSLEKQKGVDYVINAAKCLSDIYEMHILGFGSNADVERVQSLILENAETGSCKVFYDGVLKGDDYIEFIQSCHIGICIQKEEDLFNQYEYPSKVFSYLSNGLSVVVNDLIQIRRSSVYSYLNIAKDSYPENVANAIMKCEIENSNADNILLNLNCEFIENLKRVIKQLRRN